MKLHRIWSISGMTLPERLLRTRDYFAMIIAYCLPVRVQYWTTVYMIGQATKMSVNIPATPCEDILENLPKPKVVR